MKKTRKWALLAVALVFGQAAAVLAATAPPPAAAPAPASAPAPGAPAAAAPAEAAAPAISLADVAEQAEVALAQVRRLDSRGRIDDLIEASAEELPALARDISFRARETQQVLTKRATLQSIRNLEEGWSDIEQRSAAITKGLTRSALRLDEDLKELEKLETTWDTTKKAAIDAAAPPTVLTRVREVDSSVAAAKKRVLADRTKVLDLQGKSADIGARAAQTRQALAEARERAAARLLYRDSLPLWDAAFWSSAGERFSGEAKEDLLNQAAALREYADEQGWRFVLHVLFFLSLAGLLSKARSKIHVLIETDGSLRRAAKVFDLPLISAMLIGMLVSTWFYPRAPRMLWIVVSVLGAAPVLVFIRRTIDASIYPVLYAAVGFYLADRLRDVFAPFPNISRLMLLAETLLVLLFCLWTLRRSARSPTAPPWTQAATWRVIRIAIWLVLWLFIFALLSNAGGYALVADLIVRTVLGSAYTAVVLYALMRVGEGIVQGLLYVFPISLLGMVRWHKSLILGRINRWLRWAAVLSWIGLTLQGPGLLPALTASVETLWKAALHIGTFTLTVGNIFLFFFILWAAYTLSRITRFILDEEVFPKVRLERGLPYAISTMLHYVLLFSGFVLALGAIGVDMTKFTILVSAFSVGIGFGLQNIVNNFVSGLIVLFERPIKVGDIIQIDDMTGRVQRIGIRASVVHSTAGSEVIIPNGKLISDKVTNWTLSNQLRQIAVPVITKPDVDVADLKQLLLEIAGKNPLVAKKPAPEALFIKRGLDNFEFELRIWTGELDAWLQVKSDLTTEIDQALRQSHTAATAPAAPAAAAE